MKDTKDSNGELLPDEMRTPPVGKIVRRLSLDELPQMFNVLKGDMSIVGPRPLLVEYNHMYTPRQRRRLDVIPGITGYAAVNGRSCITFSKKFELDAYYADNASFMLDNIIIFKTFSAVFSGRGSTAVTNVSKVDDLGFVERMLQERRAARSAKNDNLHSNKSCSDR